MTQRKRTEEELRESEQQFRQVFNQGPLGIALVDLDSRIMNANRALCRFVGRTSSELVGATFASFTHPDDADKYSELARQLSAEMVPSYQTETRFVTDVGEVVFANVTASVIRGEHGAPIYGLRTVEDITKRKRLERELVAHATTARSSWRASHRGRPRSSHSCAMVTRPRGWPSDSRCLSGPWSRTSRTATESSEFAPGRTPRPSSRA